MAQGAITLILGIFQPDSPRRSIWGIKQQVAECRDGGKKEEPSAVEARPLIFIASI